MSQRYTNDLINHQIAEQLGWSDIEHDDTLYGWLIGIDPMDPICSGNVKKYVPDYIAFLKETPYNKIWNKEK